MGAGLDVATIKMIIESVKLIKPLLIPMMKQMIKDGKLQK